MGEWGEAGEADDSLEDIEEEEAWMKEESTEEVAGLRVHVYCHSGRGRVVSCHEIRGGGVRTNRRKRVVLWEYSIGGHERESLRKHGGMTG